MSVSIAKTIRGWLKGSVQVALRGWARKLNTITDAKHFNVNYNSKMKGVKYVRKINFKGKKIYPFYGSL